MINQKTPQSLEELQGFLYKFAVKVKSEGVVYYLDDAESILERIKSDLSEQYGEENFEILSFEPMTEEEINEIGPQLLASLEELRDLDDLDDEEYDYEGDGGISEDDFFAKAKPTKYLN